MLKIILTVAAIAIPGSSLVLLFLVARKGYYHWKATR